MLNAFLTYMNTRKIKNPMDKVYGNMEKLDDHRVYISDHITLKNIFRKEK
jgi:hypothetical protein